MKAVAGILADLVAIPSVSSMSNQPVIDYVLKRLDRRAWQVDLYPYRDPAGVKKTNMVAVAKTRFSTVPELAVVCHTDTVPFDPSWKDAVRPQVRGGRLYGRGSCDVKGFLACALAAIHQVKPSRLTRPIALVLTADEEIGCVGAKHLVRNRAFRSRSVIIGEPTGLRPVRAGKGYALGEIVVRGREAHSAFPARGHSAIYDAARVLSRLERVAKKLETRKDTGFDPAFTTLNAGLIQGGSAKNIIPGECRITVEWRPIPGQDPRWAAQLINRELAALHRRHPRLEASLDIQRLDPAFAPAGGGRLAALLESLSRHRSVTVAFGTEAAHLGALADETIVFGPGSMAVAHKTGEYVATSELGACVACLKAAIEHLCMEPVTQS